MSLSSSSPSDHRALVEKSFKNAVSQDKLLRHCKKALHDQGYDSEKILFATSTCPDEINRDLDEAARKSFGRPFSMGGLAGFPFVGKTGFGAFMHHVMDGGIMFILCASHVGITDSGEVGKIRRCGMHHDSTACGAAVAALSYCTANASNVEAISKGDPESYPGFLDQHDSQQAYIVKTVAAHYTEISSGENPMVTLAKVTASAILEDLKVIIPPTLEFPLAILAGVQVNFEGWDSLDYFEPISFTLSKDGNTQDLTDQIHKLREHHHHDHHVHHHRSTRTHHHQGQ